MRECDYCNKDVKRLTEHWRDSPDCYARRQKELARLWKRRGADLPGCYKRDCQVCGEPVYGERPEVKAHAAGCLPQVRNQPIDARDPRAKPCTVCGRAMKATHKRRRYCSNACQQRAYQGKGTERYKLRLERMRQQRAARNEVAHVR